MATQHPLNRYRLYALSVRFIAEDFVRAEVQKSLFMECATVTNNDEDARTIVAMAEPQVEHHLEAVAEAASQAIHQARIAAHQAVAAFREGRAGTPVEVAALHVAIPTDFTVDTDAFKAPMAEGFADIPRQRTESDEDRPPYRTYPYAVAAVCELCGANAVGNGWVKPCIYCEQEGVNPPLQVCNVCSVGLFWESGDSHVATQHANYWYMCHTVAVGHRLGYWLMDKVRTSLYMECAMFTENDEDARRCIAVATTPSLGSHIDAAGFAAGNTIIQARSAAHEAIAAFRKTRTGS